MAEGAPLLREYGVLSLIKGSNPFVSASTLSPLRYLSQRAFLMRMLYYVSMIFNHRNRLDPFFLSKHQEIQTFDFIARPRRFAQKL